MPPTSLGSLNFGIDDTGMVLSLCSMVDGSTQALGTAFLVLPGLAMTAAHVVTEYQDRKRLDAGLLFLAGAFQGSLRAWAVAKIRMPVKGDVALLEIIPRFELGEQLTINHVELTARLPLIGEPVLALGILADQVDFTSDMAAGEASWISVKGLSAAGRVLEFYPGRDRTLPGPTLRCDFRAPGGMSGGPVFDINGHVCGIVTSSIQVDDAWESFVSLHWPALMFTTQPQWPPALYPQEAQLWPGHVFEAHRLGIGENGQLAYFGE